MANEGSKVFALESSGVSSQHSRASGGSAAGDSGSDEDDMLPLADLLAARGVKAPGAPRSALSQLVELAEEPSASSGDEQYMDDLLAPNPFSQAQSSPPKAGAEPGQAAGMAALEAAVAQVQGASTKQPPRPPAHGGHKRRRPLSSAAPPADLATASDKATKKVKRSHEVHWQRQQRGAFAREEIAVTLPAPLASSSTGSNIKRCLEGDGYVVMPPDAAAPAGCITWHRREKQPDGRFLRREGVDLEPFAARVMLGAEFVKLAKRGVEALCALAAEVSSAFPPPSRFLLLVQGANAVVSAHQRKAQTTGAEAPLTRASMDAAVAEAFVLHGLEVRHTSAAAETATVLSALTRAVAEAPHRAKRSLLACVPKVRVSKALQASANGGAGGDSASVGSGGSGGVTTLLDTWCAQLQMIPGVSASKAVAVVKVYPSYSRLMEAYDAAGRKQGPLLLEDILEPKRKQTTLSRRVYQFFTTMDGMEMIE